MNDDVTPRQHPLPGGGPRPASAATVAANRRATAGLALTDPADFERATRGLVAQHPTGRIATASGRVVWDTGAHDFVRATDTAPDTVNPSLWRQARLNALHGLFAVADRVWQVRGYDLSNITFVAGDTSWLVIDPLTSAETAAAALELANGHLGRRPVGAVIYTHSHVDHFGGVHGVVDAAEVAAGRVPVIAPEGFLAEAVSENVVAGPVMLRRASYMYGGLLPASPTGHVDAGLGKATPRGTVGLIPPSLEITSTGTELALDGIRIEFQLTPGTEAPAEMNFHFPDLSLLCLAENCTATMHNLYTPRGAQVRDALAWSKYINEAIELFGDRTDVAFASHHWPRWGRADVLAFLAKQQDLYRWLHDQTLRLANHGHTPTEIAEQLDLPEELATEFHCRGYYGTVNHNVKAVYQRYLGWFDGNPANLHPLPPGEVGSRYVELAGGPEALLAAARAAFDAGDYRWVAELVNHLVFADPSHVEARALQADALEQLGYQAESGPWRNFYLTGAQELRHGVPDLGEGRIGEVGAALTIDQVFDALGVRLDHEAASGKHLTINWTFTDLPDGESRHVLGLANRALHHTPGRHDPSAAATVTTARAVLLRLLAGEPGLWQPDHPDAPVVDGDAGALAELLGCLDRFQRGFAIVEP